MSSDNTMDTVREFNKAKEYFEQIEKQTFEIGNTIKETLIKKFNWKEEYLKKRYTIDINSNNESVIKNKQYGVETKISDLLILGGGVYFHRKGIQQAGFKNFFTKGFRAFDLSAWQNFIVEGLKNIRGTNKHPHYNDVFDRWWTIQKVQTHHVELHAILLGTIATFPNLILTEPDYVSIKLPTNENLEHFENFQNGLNLSNEDLMNRMDSILRGKT